MEAIIHYLGVSKRYEQKEIIHDLHLKVKQGEFLTIVGESGSGKTTMLKMINGIVKPDCGQVQIKGESIDHQNIIQLRRKIGYAVQGNVLFPHLTVEQNIAYVLRLSNELSKEQIRSRVNEWIYRVGLNEQMLSRYPSELSGGEQQRVGIARAMIANPEIILMDEPFGAVDEITRTSLQRQIKQLHQNSGVTFLFVTHDLNEAFYLGTKTLILRSGTIQQYATSDEILSNPANEYVKMLTRRLLI